MRPAADQRLAGLVADVEALARALESGRLSGAALDVFPGRRQERPFQSPLIALDQVISRRISAAAPRGAGSDRSRSGGQAHRALNLGSTLTAVNFPVALSKHPGMRRISYSPNRPGMLSQINAVFSKHDVNVSSESLETDRHRLRRHRHRGTTTRKRARCARARGDRGRSGRVSLLIRPLSAGFLMDAAPDLADDRVVDRDSGAHEVVAWGTLPIGITPARSSGRGRVL